MQSDKDVVVASTGTVVDRSNFIKTRSLVDSPLENAAYVWKRVKRPLSQRNAGRKARRLWIVADPAGWLEFPAAHVAHHT